MAIYPIRVRGDVVLRTPAATVEVFDDRLRKLVEDMIETMYEAPGVGLAAPQIGISKRIFVYDPHDGSGPRAVVNPEILETSGEFEYDEGCLSVPGIFVSLVRPDHVVLKGQDQFGNNLLIEANEFHGRILQHETDHLNGLLYVERLNREQKKDVMKQWRARQMEKY